ncbi:4Fe-4S dicluster domain-containing protein [Ditylenchus destructor]|uniref:4Fe-4S dicluster domain-containing protein n=2 Tax=cellular organisms TaxID=131567 RepID=A0AAD4QV45_9BILA|nr:4Fe-4S dicluster domain-containing protein [Ditylenchus destructor]
MAVIDEAWCIGCTLCLDACPTDAIVGINKRMHTVIEAHCTGCELCIPVCPVDCISLEVETPGRSGWQAWSAEQADSARARYEVHGRHRNTDARLAETVPEAEAPQDADARKRSIVEAALARARAASLQRRPPAGKA